jgi:hypothetical protein
MKTTGSINIKDYKVNTRVLFKYKSTISTVFEGVILEFSDSGEYVCIQNTVGKTHWHQTKDLHVEDTLKNKAIEEFKDRLVKDSIEFAKKHDLCVKPEKSEETLKSHYEVYPNYKFNEPTSVYFLEIYNGKTWKLCFRNSFNVPKLGWFSSEGHPYVLGEGEIAAEYLINMYTLCNLKRIVDGLNLLYDKDKTPISPYPDFETAKEKVDWQKDHPYSVTTSP